MKRFAYPVLCLGILLASGGCSSNFGGYKRVQQVRSDYTTVWQERETKYSKALSVPSTKLPEAKDQIASREARRGALAVLSGFREFRANEPAANAAASWLRSRHAVHRTRLLETGTDMNRLVSLVADPTKLEKIKLEPDALKSLAFNLGSVVEVRLIYEELQKSSGVKAQGLATAKRPAGSPANFDMMSRGVMSGIGGVFGR